MLSPFLHNKFREPETPAPAQQSCYHCLEPVSAYANITATINGVGQPVCCHGCQAAAEFIDGSELTEFYQRRALSNADKANAAEASSQPSSGSGISTDWSFLDEQPPCQEYVTLSKQGGRQLSVYLQGVYCSSCSWLIGRTLSKISAGIAARMDIDAKRLFLEVSDPAVKFSVVLSTIEKLGYQASPIPLDAAHDGQDEQFKSENRQALKRIAVAGFGMMQVMTYAVALYFGDFQGMEQPFRRFLSLISMLVATVVVFYAGKPFFINALNDIRNRHLGMDVPIAIAIGGAFFPSVYQTLFRASAHLQGHIYFDSAVMFVFFLSVGRYVEMRARHRLTNAPAALTRMLPPYITIIRFIDDVPVELRVKPNQIIAGDRIHLADRQLLPFDGIVTSGEALVDESMISGEPQPLRRQPGDRVSAGSQLVSGVIEVVATLPWSESSIVKIERLLATAKDSSSKQSDALQNVAQYFVAGVLLITLLVGSYWWLVAADRVFEIVLAMLVASCPCAFSLAAPIGATAASHALRLKGLLLANYHALKVLPEVTVWCFDKTGTITMGKPAIIGVECYGGVASDACLQLAAAIERQNSHVLSFAFNKIDSALTATEIQSLPGQGVTARIEGRQYYLGKPAWVIEQLPKDYPANDAIAGVIGETDQDSVVALGDEDGYLASFFIQDQLRPQAATAIRMLRAHVAKIFILSGDRLSAVKKSAGHLQVDRLQGDLLPEQKMAEVRKLQAQGEIVAMLGDGVNDAPVIGQADVSIAMSSGSEVSHSQADVILLNGQLHSLNTLHEVAMLTRVITRQNLVWALLYNATALPMAAAGFLTPWLAALGMSASSLIVVLNALRISRQTT